MAKFARIAITNVHSGGDYTGQIQVGPDNRTMNVLLDTGSSQLALDARRYKLARTDKTTNLAQDSVYSDKSSWTGAVIRTTVSAGAWGEPVVLENVNVALAYRSRTMFEGFDGILGLAYSALDGARKMKDDTWQERIRHIGRRGKPMKLPPYLAQLKHCGVVSDRFAFYTRRSMVRVGHGPAADDIMNQGLFVIGCARDGRESRDLFKGRFQTARVLAQTYYNTNLKSVAVGRNAGAIAVKPVKRKSAPSNSIVDSGTNGIYLPKRLLLKMIGAFDATQQKMLRRALHGYTVWARDLDLTRWPDITFVLQGPKRKPDAKLKLKPCDYWQVDAWRKGHALTVFGVSSPSDGIILGLPLMNGYFTIFDGEADHGRGEILFATRKG